MMDIDPRGRSTVTAGSDHYFHTWCLFVRPYIRPFHFSKSRKTKNFQVRIVIIIGGIVGLAKCIIDGTHVLYYLDYKDNSLIFQCE